MSSDPLERKASLRTPIVLFVLLSIVPVALLAVFSIRLASDAVEHEVEARIHSTARASAIAVQKQMQGLADIVESYARRQKLIEALQANDEHELYLQLRELQHVRPGIATTFFADMSGELVDIVPATPSIVGEDFSFRDWYHGVTEIGTPYVSEAYRSQAAGRPYVVGVAGLVRTRASDEGARRTLGIVVAAYRLDAIQGFVEGFESSENIDIEVTDQRGTIVASSETSLDELTSIASDPQVDAALDGRSGIAADASGDEKVLTAYAPVARFGWTLTASVPARTALSATGTLRSTVITVAGVLILVLIAGFILLMRSSRGRRRAELALARNVERTRLIIDTASDAFICMDAHGVITEWNKQAEQSFGWARDEAIGRSVAETLIPSHLREAHARGLAHFLVTGEGPVLNRRVELTALHRDGHEFPVELAVWPIHSGDEVSFNAFVRDISARKNVAAAREAAKKAAEEANDAKSVFLSRMSHELRTPLTAILGFSQLLQSEELGEQQREDVDEISKAGRHLLELINEILDISRIEAGHLPISIEPVPVGELLKEATGLIRPLADERHIGLEVKTNGNDHQHVKADRQRLKQVLLNLLSNAVKYNVAGGRVMVSSVQDDDKLRISVSDTGPGIAPEKISRLFAPFDRLGADDHEVIGTGLGLALSKGLMEAMGGTIEVESSPGEGSTFSVVLEIVAGPLDHVERAADNGTGILRDTTVHGTVLYIEDNLSNLKLVERLLAERPNVRLEAAMQGRLGLELAFQHRPDLILLDLNLPDMTGVDVLHELTTDPRTANARIVMISADATPGQTERLLSGGAYAYLTKPLDVTRFLELLDEAMKHSVPAQSS